MFEQLLDPDPPTATRAQFERVQRRSRSLRWRRRSGALLIGGLATLGVLVLARPDTGAVVTQTVDDPPASTEPGPNNPPGAAVPPFAAILAHPDWVLVDSTSSSDLGDPARGARPEPGHLTFYDGPDGSVVIASREADQGTSLDGYEGLLTQAWSVGAATVRSTVAVPSTRGLAVSSWKADGTTFFVASRGLTDVQHAEVVAYLVSNPRATDLAPQLPDGFQRAYDGPDANPFYVVDPRSAATYVSSTGDRVSLSLSSPTDSSLADYAWYDNVYEVTTLDGVEVVKADNGDGSVTITRSDGSGILRVTGPRNRVDGVLEDVSYVDQSTWDDDRANAADAGSIYQTATTTTPADD